MNMVYLICENKKIDVIDYYKTKKLCYMDMKLCDKDFQPFLDLYCDHVYGKGIFSMQIGEEKFEGWFGKLLYDKDFNVRLCIGVYNHDEIERDEYGYVYNIKDSLWEVENTLSVLCNILQEEGILDGSQSAYLRNQLNCPKRALDFECLVKNLDKYLIEKHETINELRARGKQ